ncbi:hypothetical protein QBC37DRAFT_307407 [Rhypophila decipiens]|uniref:Uncharacterized protein n=1 Tax=Rhypophila decipiens TaxID=261697 RepID=A0AAN6YKD4_9PEZI|nr:hypothetical protein QBC37DRAFT_307407 [Rhypophila decipiens]
MAPKQMAIPQPFSYLLPGQGLVAGVAIYSTIYVFGVGKIPFILAVVAAGLHFLLGVYFCFVKNRLRTHDLYLVPVVLVAGAGVWAGSLYYFAKLLEVVLRLGRIVSTGSQPETATWTKVGTSMTGLNVLLDIILLIVFIVAVSDFKTPLPVASAISPTGSPSPSQQQQYYQQYQQPQTVMYQHQRQQSFTPSQQQQQQQTPQYQQQHFSSHAVSYSPSPQPPPTPPPPQPSQVQYGQSHNMAANTNRITTLRRLSALQSPPGNWIYTPELASLLVSQSPQQQPVIITPNTPSQNITLQTKHLMTILRDGISSAQREGGLTPAELSSLQGVNWDLGWVGLGIERAEGWLNMNNQSQGRGSWADIQYGGGPGAYGSR